MEGLNVLMVQITGLLVAILSRIRGLNLHAILQCLNWYNKGYSIEMKQHAKDVEDQLSCEKGEGNRKNEKWVQPCKII